MKKEYKARVKHKRDTHENFMLKDPVLLNGELVFVDDSDKLRMKVGDGSKKYSELPFFDLSPTWQVI